jgi:hypothetical protein
MSKPWYLVNRGPGFPTGDDYPRPLYGDVAVFKLCPHCEGRGYFTINPFHPGPCEASCGTGNMTQCLTCARAKAHFDRHGTLPDDLLYLLDSPATAKGEPSITTADNAQ